MKKCMGLIFIAMVNVLAPVVLFSEGKAVYGQDDNRLDYFEAAPAMRALADSVVSIWSAGSLRPVGNGNMLLHSGPIEGMCKWEAFTDQLVGDIFCSGALIGADLILTAGHCIGSESDCKTSRFVFGYAIKSAWEKAPTTLPETEIYSCDEIIVSTHPHKSAYGRYPNTPDYALVRLDRKVSGHVPLPVTKLANLKLRDPVFAIGFPSGYPVKITDGATVREFLRKEGYFTTDLDAFAGNSGSPVFNSNTYEIEGILTNGGVDYRDNPEGCIEIATYPQTGGPGEYVTDIRAISALIPDLTGR
jgi:V8-like Glu-specific endopeptidase